jgi:spore germination protein YaaH
MRHRTRFRTCSTMPAVTRRAPSCARSPGTRLAALGVAVTSCLLVLFLAPAPATSAATDRPMVSTDRPMVSTWLPYWDGENGYDRVLAHHDQVAYVSPLWYRATGAATITPYHGAGNPRWLAGFHGAGIAVVPTVNESFTGRIAAAIFTTKHLRLMHEKALLEIVVSNGYDGIDLDYERIAVGDATVESRVRTGYSLLATELCRRLRSLQKQCDITVPPKTADIHTGAGHDTFAFDYRTLASAATRLRLMLYDQHTPASEPGPVAGAPWVRAVLGFTVSQVRQRSKLELACPTYGYDWSRQGAASVVFDRIHAVIVARHLHVHYSRVQQEAFLRYTLGGRRHIVWFENARSLAAKVRIANHFQVGTLGFWYIGHESPRDWAVLRSLAL